MSKQDPMIRPGAVPWFSAEDWSPDSYLWLADNAVVCGLLCARRPGTGAFSRLEAAVLAAGKEMHVPTVVNGDFRAALERRGYRLVEGMTDPETGDVADVYVRTPAA